MMGGEGTAEFLSCQLKNIGYEWDDTNPRIQLEPRGERGYMELVPVKKLS